MNLSIIFPVYNESKRLKKLFNSIIRFNKNHIKNVNYIFVNDGSSDDSLKIIKNFKKINKNIKVFIFSYKKNLGKGFAIKTGIIKQSAEWILTADVDLSVQLEQLLNWKKKILFSKNKLYVGSRNLPQSKVRVVFLRKFIGKIMTLLIYTILKIKIKDTQCGFKLYHKSYVKKIFKNVSINGFAHDLEIILLCKKFKIDILELPIRWKHQEGSKVNVFIDSIKFFISIIYLKLFFN